MDDWLNHTAPGLIDVVSSDATSPLAFSLR
jgi:hypothetical protein